MKPVNAKRIKVTNANQTGIRILDQKFRIVEDRLSTARYRQNKINQRISLNKAIFSNPILIDYSSASRINSKLCTEE